MKPAVFLDRDGTLNREITYLYRWEDWEWIPGAIQAIRVLNGLDVATVVVTNQAGIGRGYYGESDVAALHARVRAELARHHARIDAFYHCPHRPEDDARLQCACRKPAPGLLLRARDELGLDLTRSYVVGDKAIDVQTGLAVGARSILVATGYGAEQRREVSREVPFVRDVLEAARLVEREITVKDAR